MQPTLASGIPDLELDDGIGKLHSLGDESGCSMARSAHALRQDEWIHTANSALLELQKLVTHETSDQARLPHSHMPKEYKLWGDGNQSCEPTAGAATRQTKAARYASRCLDPTVATLHMQRPTHLKITGSTGHGGRSYRKLNCAARSRNVRTSQRQEATPHSWQPAARPRDIRRHTRKYATRARMHKPDLFAGASA